MLLDGHYFLPNSSRVVPAQSRIANGAFVVQGMSGELLDQASTRQMRISSRLGSIPRRIDLPSGGRFEAMDNDVADEFLRQHFRFHRRGVAHRLERSWKWAVGALLFSALIVYLFVIYGIPVAAKELALATPLSVDELIAHDTLRALDAVAFTPSALSESEKAHIQKLFSAVAGQGQRGREGYKLVFRASAAIGANAFALPNGTIILTDELWKMVKADGEIEGVFAHEITHVDRRHGLQLVYQAAFVPAVIAFVTGDVSQASQLAAILPGILMQASYSQNLEQEADDQGAVMLRRMHISPSLLADLLERLDKQTCTKSGCPTNWLGSHPDTSLRANKLRNGQ